MTMQDQNRTAAPAVTPEDAFVAYRQTPRFAALDGLRFFAIFGVLVLHSPLSALLGQYSRLFTRGFLGVDLFFVISGFLITTLLLRERARTGKIALGAFYWRRALRILPLYLLVITAIGGYYVLLRPEPGAAELWPFYYLFLANFMIGDIPLLAPTWSLSVEEQYYLIWPLLLVLVPRRGLVAGVAVFALVYTLVVNPFGHLGLKVGPLDFSIVNAPYVAILLGAGLALVLHGEAGFRRLWPALGQVWAAPVLALVLLAELAFFPDILQGWPLLAVHLTMAALLGALVMREDTLSVGLLRFAPLVRIGQISYGIYLLHLIADHVARVAVWRLLGDPETHLLAYIPLYWGIAVAMAEISYRFYESRFLALRYRTGAAGPHRTA